MTTETPPVDAIDRALIVATQGGLPLTTRPFADVARMLGLDEAEVLARFQRMVDTGVIRRIAAVPNHYKLGYTANGMSVWVVDPQDIEAAGTILANLPHVTHSYQRPAYPPLWPYTLFAMVHATTRQAVLERVAEMAALLGDLAHGHDVLFSTRVLKKTGLRLRGSRSEVA